MCSRQRYACGSGLQGSAGRADGFHVVTDVDSSWRITWANTLAQVSGDLVVPHLSHAGWFASLLLLPVLLIAGHRPGPAAAPSAPAARPPRACAPAHDPHQAAALVVVDLTHRSRSLTGPSLSDQRQQQCTGPAHSTGERDLLRRQHGTWLEWRRGPPRGAGANIP